MPKAQTHKKSGGARKYGRNSVKCQRYRDRKSRERNKLRRILKSNGLKSAQHYAKIHGLKQPKTSMFGPKQLDNGG
jgi:hypothetical protein